MDYRLVRSKNRKRTMTILIKPDGTVEMRVPYKTLQRDVDAFFKEKSPWVQKKLMEREKRVEGETAQPKQFITGEIFFYLGERYPLEICNMNGSRAPSLSLSYGMFLLDEKSAGEAQAIFIKWYKKRAKELFAERVYHYSRQLSFFPEDIRITSAQYRYGSCSARNNLSFSWRLMLAPLPVIDYIIIHELTHIKVKNHSKKFWESVGASMPDFRTHKRWLKEHGYSLKL
jgi:predicted metal-dependent hydrolase